MRWSMTAGSDDKYRPRTLIIASSDAIRRGFLKDESTSIAQRDQSIRILRAYRPVKAAGDIEPIIVRLAFEVGELIHGDLPCKIETAHQP
jgi:hypothetical protein